MVNIEQLQQKVDEVKTDLDNLKSEVSVETKKEKEKKVLEEIKNTKEEINLRIDELKKLGETKNAAEIQKLQEMLKSLDSLSALKVEVETKTNKEVTETTEISEEEKEEKTEEEKGWFKRQREGVTSKEEWKEHTWTNVGRVAMGVGAAALVYKGIKWLFGKKNKEEGEGEEKEKKEKKPRYKKRWGIAGIGIGGILAWKNRDKIKGWFSDLFGGEKKPENEPKLTGSYEDLPEDTKVKYRATGVNVDQYTTVINDASIMKFSETEKDDQDKKGAILFGLDKETKNLNDFSTNDTLDYVENQTTDDIIDNIVNWGKNKTYNCLASYLSKLESFKPFGARFVSDPAATLREWLKSGTPEEREKELSLFYREYMNIINYVDEKKTLLAEKLAKEEIMGKDHINDEATVNQQEAIDDLLQDDKWREGKLKSFFQSHTLADLSGLIKQYNIDATAISKETHDFQDDLKDDADDMLQKDDEGSTALTRADEDFQNGSLEEDSKKELVELCEDFLEDGFGDNGRSFFGAYTHLITDIFAGNTELANSFFEKTKSKDATAEFKATLTGYIQKLKAGTFSKEDLQNLKSQTETYLKTKEQYELSMRNIDKMSKGLHFDGWKVLKLPLNALGDIGKAFGKGKTNSWRERIGYGLGGCYVSGQTLFILSKLTPRASLAGAIIKPIAGLTGKVGIEIGKLPITLIEKGLKLSTGRTHLTGLGWAKYLMFDSPHLKLLEKEILLKNAFLRGEISEFWTLHVARKLNIAGSNVSFASIDGLLEKRGLSGTEQIELFKTYKSNKNLAKLLIKESSADVGTWQKIKYTFYDRLLKSKIEFNTDALKELGNIQAFLKRCTHEGKSALVNGFLETTKSLKPEMVQEIFATQTFDKLSVEASKDIGRLLGKNMNKFSSVDDFKAFQGFFARNYAKYPTKTFVSNSLSKWSKLSSMDEVAQAKYIESAKLNISFLDKRINAMKDNFKKSAETLKKLIKGNRTPYPKQVESVANGLDDIAKISNEDLALLAESERVGNGNWLSLMSKDANLIKEISPLFKNKDFLKELSTKKTADAVRELFASKGIKSVPKEFAETLSKTTNTKKLADTMRYVERYESLGKVGKILQSPGMKYAGRILGKALGVGTVVLGGVLAYQTYQEGGKIMKTNIERGELMQEESFVDIGLTAAGACAFIPGIGWIASGVIILGTGIAAGVKEVVFDTLDKYNKNYKDFLGQAPLLIREHIISTALGGAEEDRGFGDWTVGVFKNMEHLSKKTGSEGIKALLYAEEWKTNQLAMIDINNTELMNELEKETPPITRVQVAEAISQVEKNVQSRYAYLKKRCGVYKYDGAEYVDFKKIVSLDKIKNGEGMKLLDKLMLESQYSISNPELLGDPQKIEKRQKDTLNRLAKDKTTFVLLEKLFIKDQTSLLYIYHYIDNYRQHLQQFGFDETGECIESKYDDIIKNMDYFRDYMGYKVLDKGIDVSSYSASFSIPPNFILVRDFFASNKLDKSISDKELYNLSSKLQTILYRIATEVIGVSINNTMDDIKNVFTEHNEDMYGIYFDNGDIKRLSVNGNYFTDTEYAGNDVQTVKQIRADIQAQVDNGDLIDVGTGDTIFNKEIGNKYLKIIDQELIRS